MAILFTQYKLPVGKKEHVTFDFASSEVEDKAHKLLDHGFHFDIELLMTGMVSMTCEYTSEYTEKVGPVSIQISPNGPGIDQYVEQLINDAYTKWLENPNTFPQVPSLWRKDLEILEMKRAKAEADWDF